jgi:hypothetical protein
MSARPSVMSDAARRLASNLLVCSCHPIPARKFWGGDGREPYAGKQVNHVDRTDRQRECRRWRADRPGCRVLSMTPWKAHDGAGAAVTSAAPPAMITHFNQV